MDARGHPMRFICPDVEKLERPLCQLVLTDDVLVRSLPHGWTHEGTSPELAAPLGPEDGEALVILEYRHLQNNS